MRNKMKNNSTIKELLDQMGQAGARLDQMHAVEASAGNISISINWPVDLESVFPDHQEKKSLPWAVPALAGRTVFVTGSGCRLRDIGKMPAVNVSAFVIDEGGRTGTWYTHPDKKYHQPTSEFNSHLAVHNDQVARRKVEFQAVVHAQPPYLVALSHHPELLNNTDYNRAIFRWEPETIVQVPQGIEVLDFMVPGSQELMENNLRGLRDHEITLWAKHGIMVRSDLSPLAAVDKVEYLETGAMYEYLNTASGGKAEGLTDEEIRRVISAFGVKTTLY